MKLLFDENLSPSLPRALASMFPGSLHVRDARMQRADDDRIWRHAAANDFVIVSKDDDFRQRALVHGPPPKVIGLLLGNCTVEETIAAIRNHAQFLNAFADDSMAAYFAIERPAK